MRTHLQRNLIIGALAVACTIGAALAAGRAVGDQLVYIMKMTVDLPQSAVQLGMRPTTDAALTLTLQVDTLNPDGSAHATGTAISPADAASTKMMGEQGLEATILDSGAIVPKYDAPEPATNPATQSRTQQTATANQFKANYAAGLVQRRIGDFNEFALGCSKKSAFKTGDAWRLVDTQGKIWMFAVTGTDQVAGHSVVIITMKNSSQDQDQTSKSDATGDYDPTGHLVVLFHIETVSTHTYAPGVSKLIEDIALE